MELSSKQQTLGLIKNAQRILIATHKNPDGDAVGSTIALKNALQELGKEVTAVYPGELNKVFEFLPTIEKLSNNIEGNRDFVIVVDTTKLENSELKLGYKHDKTEKKLSIIVSPNKGYLSKADVSFKSSQPKFDLIIVLDCPDLERLDTLYDEYTQLFYETPIVNVDHHPGNDHFGKVNWIDLTATSTCEILVSLFESLSSASENKKLLTEDTATALLTGIITDTGSFQNSNTTPKSLTVAAQLVAAGAHQQEIIRYIFKTKTLTTLKLWGTVLSNVMQEENPQFVYSTVSMEEIIRVGAKASDLSGVIDELLKNAPGVEFAVLLSERFGPNSEKKVLHANLRAVNPAIDVASLASKFNGGGHSKAAAFEIPREGKFSDQIQDIIEKIKSNFSEIHKNTSDLELPENI